LSYRKKEPLQQKKERQESKRLFSSLDSPVDYDGKPKTNYQPERNLLKKFADRLLSFEFALCHKIALKRRDKLCIVLEASC
jgi:hypothetical protein